MALLDEFDAKIEHVTTQLEKLLQESGRIQNVNDLLEENGSRHAETNQALITIYKSLADLSGTLKSEIVTLDNTTEVIKSADPSKIINIVDKYSQSIKSDVNSLNEKYSSLINELKNQTALIKAIPESLSTHNDTIASLLSEIAQKTASENSLITSKIRSISILGIINLIAVSIAIGVILYM